MTSQADSEEFAAFVHRHWAALMSAALAVSGNRHDAEDLVQGALTSCYSRWDRIQGDQALAYLRRCIVNAHVSRWRRHRGAELSLAELPERPGHRSDPVTVDERQSLLPLLRALAPRQRAVLVLRYLCDLPDDQIADTLGVSPATVRTQAARGLTNLRAQHELDNQPRPVGGRP